MNHVRKKQGDGYVAWRKGKNVVVQVDLPGLPAPWVGHYTCRSAAEAANRGPTKRKRRSMMLGQVR